MKLDLAAVNFHNRKCLVMKHIALKFCIWLCFTVLQIKFECCQFPSMFVGVMPLLELIILEIHSFPHFSPACFDILSWNFAYDFILLYYRAQYESQQFASFFVGVLVFWTKRTGNTQFIRIFLIHVLANWADILHMTHFMNSTSSSSVNQFLTFL